MIDAGVGTALNLTKLKFVNKALGKIGNKLAKGKIGQNLMKFGNKFVDFQNKINNKLDKNALGKFAKEIGKGIKDDIIERKDEYRSALGDIVQDLAYDEIPGEKIANLLLKELIIG